MQDYYAIIMVSSQLIEFMRTNFGNQCLSILNQTHRKLGVSDIEEADVEDKKNFILELQPLLRDTDLAHSEIVISELMSILNVNLSDNIHHHIGLSKENKQIIHSYIMKLGEKKKNAAYQEIDSLIHLYLKNTKAAVKRKVPAKEIHRMTDRVLSGLRAKLSSITYDVESEFNIRTNIDFIEMRVKDLEERGEYFDIDKISNQTSLAKALKEYNDKMDSSFKKFRKGFLDSLNKKIYLEKANIPSDHILKRTARLSEEFRKEVEEIYDSLRDTVL